MTRITVILRRLGFDVITVAFTHTSLNYKTVSSITPTQWSGCNWPTTNAAIILNTVSEKPPTFKISSCSTACVVPYGCISIHTSFALGLRRLNTDHSCIIAVAPCRLASSQDSLSDTKITASALTLSRFNRRNGALQLVPPPRIAANFWALPITESRGFKSMATTSVSNGNTRVSRFLRSNAAATKAATSIHYTELVAVPRQPVTGELMEPDTSGHTTTRPAISGTFTKAISNASCKASRSAKGIWGDAAL